MDLATMALWEKVAVGFLGFLTLLFLYGGMVIIEEELKQRKERKENAK